MTVMARIAGQRDSGADGGTANGTQKNSEDDGGDRGSERKGGGGGGDSDGGTAELLTPTPRAVEMAGPPVLRTARRLMLSLAAA